MMSLLADPQTWITLFTLSAIEIVLGIDNLVFISIAVSRLPHDRRERARKFGIAVACLTRIALLLTLAYLAGMTRDLFTVFGQGVSIRDLVEGEGEAEDIDTKPKAVFWAVIAQIAVIDIVFSLDSVIAAVGMANQKPVMVGAILLSVAVMLWAATPIGRFIERNPTIKMLALAFIVLVGAFLVAEGFGAHVPKGYIYFAMGFSAVVESLNLWVRKRAAERVPAE